MQHPLVGQLIRSSIEGYIVFCGCYFRVGKEDLGVSVLLVETRLFCSGLQ